MRSGNSFFISVALESEYFLIEVLHFLRFYMEFLKLFLVTFRRNFIRSFLEISNMFFSFRSPKLAKLPKHERRESLLLRDWSYFLVDAFRRKQTFLRSDFT